jgi:uncharacterized protein (TIGR02246 family)
VTDSISAADRLAVHELVARYAWALDTSDADLMASVFTPDGSFTGDVATYSGHAQLRAWVASRSAELRATQHVVSNLMLRAVADAIEERSLCLIVGPAGGHFGVQSSGYYEGRVVQHDGTWLFAARHFRHW